MSDIKTLINSIARTDLDEIRATASRVDSLSEYKGFILRHLNGEKFLVIHYKQIQEAKEFMLQEGIKGLEINISLGYPGLDVDFLKDFTFLEHLSIIHQPMRKIEAVNTLNNLRSLSIDSYFYSEVDFNNFPHLERCFLQWLPKAKNLFELTSLKRLQIRSYKKKDTSEFAKLINLEFLSIVNSPIHELVGLNKLSNLTELNLAYLRNLTSLEGIKNLTQLEKLTIEACKKVNSIDTLETLINLKKIHLLNCGEIASLKPLEKQVNLEEFLFSGNVIDGDMTPFLKLRKLSKVIYNNRKHYSHRYEDLPLNKYN